MSEPEFKQWVVIELMGHRKLSGYASEQAIAGTKFIRLDIFAGSAEQPLATQFYAPGSVYAITPTTEAIARRYATHCQPEPIARWELPGATISVDDCEVDDEKYSTSADDYDDVHGYDDEDFPA